jgi:hypothetical protein
MRARRVAAVLLAVVAAACYGATIVLGARAGWVIEISGLGGGPPEPYDVWGELPWHGVLFASSLVGAGLAVKLPRHPVPWLLAIGPIGFLAFPPIVLVVAATAVGPVPAWTPYVAWVGNWIWVVGQIGVIYLLILFPDGRPLNDRWRTIARVGLVYIATATVLFAVVPWLEAAPTLDNPFGIEVLGPVAPLITAYVFGFVLLLALGILSIVLRFVRSTGAERQQMKWMALGAGTTFAVAIPAVQFGAPRWILAVPGLVLLAAIVVAVTRYRLYEIDRVISRTLSYGLLTVLLAGVYVTGVVGLGTIIRAVTGGGGGDLVVAASTLAVAALFQPLRRRVQALVDRRFNRARYDAQRTVEAFAQRLREEVDLEALSGQLRDVASAAIQPRSVSVWLPNEDGSP